MKGYINKERKRAHVRNKMDAHSRQNGRTFYLKRAFIFFKRIKTYSDTVPSSLLTSRRTSLSATSISDKVQSSLTTNEATLFMAERTLRSVSIPGPAIMVLII